MKVKTKNSANASRKVQQEAELEGGEFESEMVTLERIDH
jgi:hypothetical protein